MPETLGGVFGYILAMILTGILVLAVMGGALVGTMAVFWRVAVARERWLAKRELAREARAEARMRANAAERPVRRIGGDS